MQIEFRQDASLAEPKVIVMAAQMNDEVHLILSRLADEALTVLAGFRDGKLTPLEHSRLIRVYAAAGKVYAVTSDGEYALRLRLYELEARLDHSRFARISNSEIINLKMVHHFDLSLAGFIRVTFMDGTATYVSRRYVSKTKQVLGI